MTGMTRRKRQAARKRVISRGYHSEAAFEATQGAFQTESRSDSGHARKRCSKRAGWFSQFSRNDR